MKSIFRSKTFWGNLGLMLLPVFVPGAQAFITAHPVVATSIGTGVNILNRVLGTSTAVNVLPL